MKFKIQEREYDFDGEYTAEEAMIFFDKAQVGMNELAGAVQRGNPYVLVTLMFILKKRAGEAVRWEDLRHLPLSTFTSIPDEPTAVGDDAADDKEGAGEASDPTEDGGTTPESGTTNT